MKDTISARFVEKAIAKTKSHQLVWSSMIDNSHLHHIRPHEISDVIKDLTLDQPVASSAIDYRHSFFAKFKSGYIFLLSISRDLYAVADPLSVSLRYLSLQIQENSTGYAKEIADSDDPGEIAIQLKRLYNLAENSALNLDGFIDDFLNS